MSKASTVAQDAARDFLARTSAAEATFDLGTAANWLVQRLGDALKRWIGHAGHEALLLRALRETAVAHPLLQDLQFRDGRLHDDAQHRPPPPAAAIAAAIVALLASYVDLLGRVVGTDMAVRLTDLAFVDVAPPATSSDVERKGD